MNDILEQAHYNKEELKEEREEVKILLEHYKAQLLNATNNETIQDISFKIERKEKEIKELTEKIKDNAMIIIEFTY